jgi:pyridoxine/pyridoxamine 5'-phosphate oxidase
MNLDEASVDPFGEDGFACFTDYRNRKGQDLERNPQTSLLRGTAVPGPPPWGGFRLVPAEFESWQGRENRLHDRIRYLRADGGAWAVARLSP